MALTKAKLIELIDNGDIDVGGGGGQNILHNWDFRNPVNQRGVSAGTATTYSYIIDRWAVSAGTSYSVIAGSHVSLAANGLIQQIMDGGLLRGKEVTITVIYESGTVSTATGTFPTGANTETTYSMANLGNITLQYWGGNTVVQIKPVITVNITAIKLELGTVSTLAYDPPMDHAVELAKCQRFFFHSDPDGISLSIRFPIAYGTTPTWYFRGYNGFPTTMRITPTAEIVEAGIGNVGSVTPYASISDISSNGITGMNISGRSAAPTSSNNLYARIKFSADL